MESIYYLTYYDEDTFKNRLLPVKFGGGVSLAFNLDECLYDVYVDQNIANIKKVVFNDPATIVFWEDGTKTVVKCDKERYDPEKGLAMAIAKKALGNKGNYYEVIKKWVGEDKLFPEKSEKKSEKKTGDKCKKKTSKK